VALQKLVAKRHGARVPLSLSTKGGKRIGEEKKLRLAQVLKKRREVECRASRDVGWRKENKPPSGLPEKIELHRGKKKEMSIDFLKKKKTA